MRGHRGVRGSKVAAIAVTVMAATAGGQGAIAAQPEPLGIIELGAGQHAFWDGPAGIHHPQVDTTYDVLGRAGAPREVGDAACAQAPGRCFDYRIEVAEEAWRLRVAFDTPDEGDFDQGDSFDIYLYDPDGNQIDFAGQQEDAPAFHRFSDEVFADDPALGSWTARIFAYETTDAVFRMRAKLETEPHPETERRALMPNLRATPPFDLTFQTPVAASSAGWGPTIAGSPTQGCSVDEAAEYGSTRCLRFSAGPENVGEGDLKFRYVVGSDPTRGPVMQEIEYTSGPSEERPAGEYEWDPHHGHYHHGGFHGFTLHRVTDPEAGTMELAGTSRKHTYCMGSYMIADWRSFANVRPVLQGSCFEPGASVGLSAGWADAYPYRVQGNYVDFGNNPDGMYLVRFKINRNDWIHESNYADNHSYALIQVSGDSINVLERGYGMSPWDPDKILADDFRMGTAAP